MKKLVVPGIAVPALMGVPERLRKLLRDAKADATKRAYVRDWENFAAWCAARGRVALPAAPVTIAEYLVDRVEAGLRVSSVARALSGIQARHLTADPPHDPPPTRSALVRETLAALRRRNGVPPRRVAPMTPDILRRALPGASPRDRAILLLGYAGAFREGELCAIHVEDVQFSEAGLVVQISGVTPTGRRKVTKQTQGAEVRHKAVRAGSRPATCPVAAVRAWLRVRPEGRGPLFNVGWQTVIRVVKRAAARAGEDPANYAGHSLRAGLVTHLRSRGASNQEIMAVTLHEREETLSTYDRPADAFSRLPADVGL